jgi:hypothetical protein
MPDAAYAAGRQMCAADEGTEGKHEQQCHIIAVAMPPARSKSPR